MAKKISIPSIHERYEQVDVKKHLYALDGISGLGSLVIMIFHFGLFASHLEGHPYPLSKLLAPIYQYGYLAVEFFFLMSGFVIEYSYSKKVKTYTFYQFLLKRIQRLYPLLMLTTILTGILQLIYYQMMGREYFFIHPITLWGAFLHFFGLQNAGLSVLTFNGPAWYVGVLVLMYLLYYYSSINIHRIKIYGLFIIIGVYIYCGKYNLPFLNEAIARGCVSFFAGVLLCIYYKNRNPKHAFLLGCGGGGHNCTSKFFAYLYLWGNHYWKYNFIFCFSIFSVTFNLYFKKQNNICYF